MRQIGITSLLTCSTSVLNARRHARRFAYVYAYVMSFISCWSLFTRNSAVPGTQLTETIRKEVIVRCVSEELQKGPPQRWIQDIIDWSIELKLIKLLTDTVRI